MLRRRRQGKWPSRHRWPSSQNPKAFHASCWCSEWWWWGWWGCWAKFWLAPIRGRSRTTAKTERRRETEEGMCWEYTTSIYDWGRSRLLCRASRLLQKRRRRRQRSNAVIIPSNLRHLIRGNRSACKWHLFRKFNASQIKKTTDFKENGVENFHSITRHRVMCKLTNSNMSADNGRYICYDVLWQIHFCGEFNGRRVRSPVEDDVVHCVSVCKDVIEDSTVQSL